MPTITSLDVTTWVESSRPRGGGGGMSKCYLTFDAEFKWTNDATAFVPVMSGGLLAMSRRWWAETGGYDAEMHGWGGDASEADAFASTARKRGIATAALEGGGPDGWQSWNAGGSSSSPGPRGATCRPGSTDYCSYYAETCDCDASDGCWWTTCEDSTQVLLDALEAVKKMLCVDLDQVWVAGCSNGAMMVYEALADSRSAGIFVGGVSIVGAPRPAHVRVLEALDVASDAQLRRALGAALDAAPGIRRLQRIGDAALAAELAALPPDKARAAARAAKRALHEPTLALRRGAARDGDDARLLDDLRRAIRDGVGGA